jgi:hypothetical protein
MLLRTALAAIVALLACAGSAEASSLVYIKDYNVWLASPDGTVQRQVTTDGYKELPYESPSQADDGTILAGRGLRFVKLDRQGNRIGSLLPSIMVGKPAYAYAVGPFDPKISPDGHKLAYWLGTWSMWFDYGNNITWTDPKDAVIWQDADSGAQLGFTLFYQKPAWLQDSQHALLNQPYNRLAAQVVGSAVGGLHNDVTPVFKDDDSLPAGEYYSQDVGDAELTPAGDKLVALRGTSQETIRFYDTRSGHPVVSECYLGQPVGGSAADPTWAPDGGAVAWAEGDGVWSTPVGALDSADCSWGKPRLIIPGASQPDWGPADVTPSAPKPAGSAPNGPQSGGSQSRPLVVVAAARIKRAALLRRGLKVTVTTAQAGSVAATLQAGRRVLARRSRPFAAQQSAVLRLKPARRQAARVRRARALELRVKTAPHVQTQKLALRGVLRTIDAGRATGRIGSR